MAFARELEKDGVSTLPTRLADWLGNKPWASRVFVLTDRGLYHGSTTNLNRTKEVYDWWTFEGVTKFLRDGPQQAQDSVAPLPAAAEGDNAAGGGE